jgi:hypothetical protein
LKNHSISSYDTRDKRANTVLFQTFLLGRRTIDLTPVATLESKGILCAISDGYDHHRILLQPLLNKETWAAVALPENGIA